MGAFQLLHLALSPSQCNKEEKQIKQFTVSHYSLCQHMVPINSVCVCVRVCDRERKIRLHLRNISFSYCNMPFGCFIYFKVWSIFCFLNAQPLPSSHSYTFISVHTYLLRFKCQSVKSSFISRKSNIAQDLQPYALCSRSF